MIDTVPDFVIPSDKDELLESHPGKYSIKNVYPIRNLQNVITDTNSYLKSQGPSFILEHFDEFFSLLVHGNNVNLPVFMVAFDRLYKCLDMFVAELEKEFEEKKEPSIEDKPRLLAIAKMLIYLLGSLIRHIEVALFDDVTVLQPKRKKGSDKSDLENTWHNNIDKLLVLIYQWVNLPLEKLWNPPIAEGTFVVSVADICYRVLERCKAAKDKPIRESIFQILGILVKRYNYSMSCIVKIVQLVKLCDGLAPHLATGMVQLIEETQCTGVLREILREVDKATPEEGGTRNIATFLEKVASAKSELLLPVITNLTTYLDEDCHLMRHCVIGILGNVVKDVLPSEDLSEADKAKRNECLDLLLAHMRDSNSYVKTKTLHVWQSLCSDGVVPLANQTALLKSTILRLRDKSSIVRKAAYVLLKTLLQCNPFAGKLDHEDLAQQLADAKDKQKNLKLRFASVSEPGAAIRKDIWKLLAPSIHKEISNVPVKKYSEENKEEFPDLDAAFETVRQLLLGEKFLDALELLIKINSNIPGAVSLDDMTGEAREEYLLSLMHKILMESQDAEGATENPENNDPDRPNERSRERKKREAEYNSQIALVNYIKDCSIFANKLASAIPVAEKQTCSATPNDAIEACSFLGMAYQFKVKGAQEAMRKALYQSFHPDVSVRENLAMVYKEIYIGADDLYKSERQKALVIVKVLTKIFMNLKPGESPALATLITTWREKGILGNEAFQIMWERFSLKLPDTSSGESRVALSLLSMAAAAEHPLFRENFDVLVTVGLGPRAETDLLLARDTCRALSKVRVDPTDPLQCPSRLPSDHELFQKLLSLLINKFPESNNSCYTTFCIEAINATYHLADQPEPLMKQLLIKLIGHFVPPNDRSRKKTMQTSLLANMCTIVGHVAIREMVHLDISIYKELKRRNTLMEMATQKKNGKNKHNMSIRSMRGKEPDLETPSSASHSRRLIDNSTVVEDSGEQALEGATADDSDAEFIQNILENEIVTGNGLLTKFVPLIVYICSHPEKFTDEQLQTAATLALSKMMTVSSVFCKDHLQLLITILERSPHPSNRANVLVGLTDMMNRFPNTIEPWTQHIYGRLKDESPQVRRTCVKMLASLIMKEMVRVKGQVSELAVCLVDLEADICEEVTQFFSELANKGNALYNILPDILSRLTDPALNLEEDKFRKIIKYILGLVQKEKQIDSIIEKICVRFKLATSERQWRDLSYCLSLLKFNSKGICRLTDNLDLMKDKIHHPPVLKVLQDIIDSAKKKPETKTACLELEEKLEKMLTSIDNNHDPEPDPDPEAAAMPPPRERKIKKSRRRT